MIFVRYYEFRGAYIFPLGGPGEKRQPYRVDHTTEGSPGQTDGKLHACDSMWIYEDSLRGPTHTRIVRQGLVGDTRTCIASKGCQETLNEA